MLYQTYRTVLNPWPRVCQHVKGQNRAPSFNLVLYAAKSANQLPNVKGSPTTYSVFQLLSHPLFQLLLVLFDPKCQFWAEKQLVLLQHFFLVPTGSTITDNHCTNEFWQWETVQREGGVNWGVHFANFWLSHLWPKESQPQTKVDPTLDLQQSWKMEGSLLHCKLTQVFTLSIIRIVGFHQSEQKMEFILDFYYLVTRI